ncbi:MAG: hypothetical protein KKE61_15070, partial [Proteobacteria bacterium]|nr:hypothetical protein [Pseudomonadota bacterium]
SSDGAQFLDDMNIDLIPSIYASADYFDTDWIQEKLSLVRETTNFHFTENNFRMLLYAWRGIYYHEVGKQTGITYLPNPQRNLFIEKLMIPGKALFDSGSKAVSFIAKTIADPRFQLIQKLARNKEREFAINLSPFFSYVLNQCSTSRMEIVDQVRQLRDRKDFRQLRKIISRYDQAYQDENLLDLHELTKEIEKSMKNFNKRHGLENVAVSVFPKLPFGLLEIKGTDELLKYPISKIFFKEIFQKPYLALMWDISKNLMKRGFGLEQLCKLQPLKQEEPHPVEWILMEQSQCVKFKGDPMATDLAKGEFYITGDVAAVCNYQQFGFQNYNQMMKASGRPAQQARTICDDDD